MTSPTFSLTDILIRGRQTNSQVIVSGVPSRRKKGRLIAGYRTRRCKDKTKEQGGKLQKALLVCTGRETLPNDDNDTKDKDAGDSLRAGHQAN